MRTKRRFAVAALLNPEMVERSLVLPSLCSTQTEPSRATETSRLVPATPTASSAVRATAFPQRCVSHRLTLEGLQAASSADALLNHLVDGREDTEIFKVQLLFRSRLLISRRVLRGLLAFWFFALCPDSSRPDKQMTNCLRGGAVGQVRRKLGTLPTDIVPQRARRQSKRWNRQSMSAGIYCGTEKRTSSRSYGRQAICEQSVQGTDHCSECVVNYLGAHLSLEVG